MNYKCPKCDDINHENDWHYYTVTHENPYWDWKRDKFNPTKPGIVTIPEALQRLKDPKRERGTYYWFICPSCEREITCYEIMAIGATTNEDATRFLRGVF